MADIKFLPQQQEDNAIATALGIANAINGIVTSSADRKEKASLNKLATEQKSKEFDLQTRNVESEIAKRQAEIDNLPAKKQGQEESALLRQLQIQKLQKEMADTAKGKPLPAGEAAAFGTANSAITALNDVNSLVDKNKDLFGPFAGRAAGLLGVVNAGDYGKLAASANAQLEQRAQIIGKYLEGGKLAEGDIKRYVKQLPQLTDSPEVAKNKVESLQRLILQKQQAEQQSLGGAGFSVQGLPVNKTPPSFSGSIGGKQNSSPLNESISSKNSKPAYNKMSDAELDAQLKAKGLIR